VAADAVTSLFFGGDTNSLDLQPFIHVEALFAIQTLHELSRGFAIRSSDAAGIDFYRIRRQREHRRQAFSRLSEEEKAAAWKSRFAWLTSELTRLVQHGQPVEILPRTFPDRLNHPSLAGGVLLSLRRCHCS
jgi:hypothetical protein